MESIIHDCIMKLRDVGESESVEAKSYKEKIGDKSLLESISAFSNTNGGYILIGIGQHPNYELIGEFDFDKMESEISTLCANEFNVKPEVSIEKETIEEKHVILIKVKESTQPLYIKKRQIEKAFFIRIGNANFVADSEDIKRIFLSKSNQDFEMISVPRCQIDEIDNEIIDMYKQLRSKTDPNAKELKLNKIDFLKALNCITDDKINKLGILCFGCESLFERFFTSCVLDYIMMDSNQWVNDPSRFEKNWKIRKSIILQRIEIQDSIEKNIKKIFSHTENIESQEISAIPLNAIDEAVTNALMHRDYSVNSSIQIIQYGNRIEFRNPGYSLKPLDSLKESGSRQRNPKLCLIFEKIRFCESIGTGIKTMMEAMKRYNLDEPVIDSNKENNCYMLTFLYKHLMDETIQDHLKPFVSKYNLLDIEITALAYVYKIGHINNEVFRQINKVDIHKASESLKKLVKKGLLINKGVSKRGSDYEPTSYFLEGK